MLLKWKTDFQSTCNLQLGKLSSLISSHFLAGELHKSNAARKDAELQELRRVVAAKEKSIDSLRTQLATAKGSLEAYTQESEAIIQQRDGEVS